MPINDANSTLFSIDQRESELLKKYHIVSNSMIDQMKERIEKVLKCKNIFSFLIIKKMRLNPAQKSNIPNEILFKISFEGVGSVILET